MKLEDMSRREFSKLFSMMGILATLAPASFAKQALKDTISTKEFEKLMNYQEACDEDFKFNGNYFHYTTVGDTKIIKEYLQKEKEIERKFLVGEKEIKVKEKKSIQEWLEQGIIPDIKYDLSYSNDWAQAATKVPWVNSEIKIDIIASENRDDKFYLDTVDPDFKFTQKTKKGKTTLKEELSGDDAKYIRKRNGFFTESNERLTYRDDIDVHSRVIKLYTKFRDFLSTEYKTKLPLFIGGEVVDIEVNIRRLSDEWFSIYSKFDHQKEKLIREKSYDDAKVKRVDALLYMPPNSNIGLPYEINFNTLKFKIEKKKIDKKREEKYFLHDHSTMTGKLKV